MSAVLLVSLQIVAVSPVEEQVAGELSSDTAAAPSLFLFHQTRPDQTRPHHAIMAYHIMSDRAIYRHCQPMPCHVMQSATLIGRYKWQRHRSKVLAAIGVIVLSSSYNYED